MKRYIFPKIKVVKLDANQAILEVCKVGGQYFMNGSTRCTYYAAGPAPTDLCVVSVRGYRKGSMANNIDDASLPS